VCRNVNNAVLGDILPAKRQGLAHARTSEQEQHDEAAELLRTGCDERGLLGIGQDSAPDVVDLQLDDGRGLGDLAPLHGLGKNHAQHIELAVDRPGFDRLAGGDLSVRAPAPGQPIALELLDPVRGDLVEKDRSEDAIQRLRDLTFAGGRPGPGVHIHMVPEVRRRELGERDVLLLEDAVPRLQEAVALDGDQLRREALVAGFERDPIPTATDAFDNSATSLIRPTSDIDGADTPSARKAVITRWQRWHVLGCAFEQQVRSEQHQQSIREVRQSVQPHERE
jgi:hypothetical protein